MHNKAIEALHNHLVSISKHLAILTDPASLPGTGLIWPQGDGRIFHLPEPWAQEIRDKAVELASLPAWRARFTVTFLRKSLSIVLVRAHDGGRESAMEMLKSVIDMLDSYSIERQVYVPVTGIELRVPELALGQVVLKRFDDSLLERFKNQMNKNSKTYPPEQLEASKRFEEIGEKKLYGKVCAEFTAIAEPDRAFELAKEQARRAVELVTFACIALLPPEDPRSNIIIGLEGEVPQVGPWLLSVSDHGVDSFHSAPISAMPIPLDAGSIQGLHAIGAMALSDMMARPAHQLTNLEETLIRSVHWLAASQAQVELQNRLLNLNTAIETLLTTNRGGITSYAAEGVALLIGNSFEERRQVKKFVTEMYGHRSAVSHGGKKELAEEDVKKLGKMVARLITTLVRHKDDWRSKKQIDEWLERKRLGA